MEPNNSQPNALVIDENALKQDNKKKWLSVGLIVKAVFLVILIGIVFEVYLGVQSLNGNSTIFTKNTQTSVNGVPILPAGDSTKLILLSDQSQYKIGDKINVDLKIATFGKVINSATVVIKYDPKVLNTDGENFFSIGDAYSANPVITKNALTGEIRISAATGSPTNGFSGAGILGSLKFIAKTTANTQISIDLSEKGSSTPSFSDNKNILGQVTNLDLNIK